MNESRSIWNENPTFYILTKRMYSAVVTIIFPFAIYCVLVKSPKVFGNMKWILLFHSICIFIEWLSNAFLIDIFDFQPSVCVKLDGYLAGLLDSVFLYSTYQFIEEVTSTSALILFCSRLLLIANMYRPYRSSYRYFLEFLVYLAVALFGLWPIPTTIYHIPDQISAKMAIVFHKDNVPFPDCLFDETTVVTSDVEDESYSAVILTLVNWISIAVAIFLSAKVAFWMLSRRMRNESEATRKMHQKFNQRTIFQAIIYLSFASIPFTLLQLTILLNLHVSGLSYLIDLFSENHPTACAVTLFLYYDPYQFYLLEVIGVKKNNVVKSSTIVLEHSTRI